jgi:DUF4097 and DUF4098 domain-containing protein YvlB
MSSYPPPPPPPQGGPYQPYDRYAAKAQFKAQQQAIKTQRRLQQAQFKAQRRAMRRTSVVGPLILLTLGVVFLLAEFHHLSGYYALAWFGRWWPLVLIVAGLIFLAEWALDQRRVDGAPGARTIGGGVIALLIFLAFAGIAAHVTVRGIEWKDQNIGEGFGQFDQLFGNRNDSYDNMSAAIAPGASLIVRDPHGDVTVNGSSTDGQVHVDVHTQSYSWNEGDLQRKINQLRPVFTKEGNDTVLSVAWVRGGDAQLTITVPPASPVTVNADHGDVSLSGLHSNLSVSANHGDVEMHDIEGNIQATVNDDDATVTVSDIKGSVNLQGHTGDIDISQVSGPLTLQGNFFGTTHLAHIDGGVHFDTSRTHFSAARLDDEFSVEKDSLDATALLGPVVLKTEDKNITLSRTQGAVNVTNSNGEVVITNASPVAAITVENKHGSVEVGVPPGSSFVLNAQTRNGDMENDFGLSTKDENDTHSLAGTVGNGGAKITIATSDGDVTVRKSSVAPVPPTPPAPVAEPASPAAPAVKAPKLSRAPAAPKAPEAPKSPASVTF